MARKSLDEIFGNVKSSQINSRNQGNQSLDEIFGKQTQEVKEETPNLLTNPLKTLARSGGQYIGDIVSTVAHPVQTVKGLFNLGQGAIQTGFEGAVEGIAGKDVFKQKTEQQEVFDAAVNFYKDRYGSVENAKQTMLEDPVGFLGDVSMVFQGGGGLLKQAGKLGQVAKAGSVASKVGGVVSKTGKAVSKIGTISEPINVLKPVSKIITKPIAKVVENVAGGALGVSTGAGLNAIRTAFKAPTDDFKKALRGFVDETDILKNARDAFYKIKDDMGTSYRKQLNEIKNSTQNIDIKPVIDNLDDKLRQFNITKLDDGTLDFSRSVISDGVEANRVSDMLKTIEKWDDMTPAGLDILKQRLDDFYSPSSKARAIVTSVKSTLRDLLVKNVEGYEEMTSGYRRTKNLLDDINRSLDSKNPDTAIKKITNAVRQDNKFKQGLLEELQKASDVDILGQISGYQLNTLFPKGFTAKILGGFSGLGALSFNPALLLPLVAASPRIVGELLVALGLTTKQIDNVLDFLTKPEYAEIRNILMQSGRIGEETNIEEQITPENRKTLEEIFGSL
jgi:hypothetical protein